MIDLGEFKAKLTPHPILRLPSDEVILRLGKTVEGRGRLQEVLTAREERIAKEIENPLEHGYEPPIWGLADDLLCQGKKVIFDFSQLYPVGQRWRWDPKLANSEFERRFRERVPKCFQTTGSRELMLMGANQSAKSRWAARKVVQLMRDIDGARVWAASDTEKRSIDSQQNYVHGMLPPELRQVKRLPDRITKISYAQGAGFSDGYFVLPNRSQCRFMYYKMDKSVLEGEVLDMFWGDELIPLSWIKTVRMRLVTRNGILVITFTPVDGWTEAVAEYQDDAVPLLTRPAVILPDEEIAVVEKCKNGAHILRFNAFLDNGFTGHSGIREVIKGQSKQYILERTEGVATKAFGVVFPLFNKDVHVVEPKDIPSIGTWYMIVDPARDKPWVFAYALVTPGSVPSIYWCREWPCELLYVEGEGYIGAWAESGDNKADGKAGPGQAGLGWGATRYVEEFNRIESGEPLIGLQALPAMMDKDGNLKPMRVYDRIIDSRAREEKVHGLERTTNLRELLELADESKDYTPASGVAVTEGVTILHEYLYYKKDEPISETNRPRMYFSKECQNMIWAFSNWTGKDGDKGACKDFIDPARYLVLQDPEHVDTRNYADEAGRYF